MTHCDPLNDSPGDSLDDLGGLPPDVPASWAPGVRREVVHRAFETARVRLMAAVNDLEVAYPDGRLANAVGAFTATLEYLDWCVRNRTEDP